jgi:hypothetical protein
MRRPLPAAALSLAFLLAATLILARGCSSSLEFENPFAGRDAVVEMRAAQSPAPRRAVVVVGDFENPPSSPLPWTDIGAGVSEIVRDHLLGDGAFHVQIHPGLAGRIGRVVLRPSPESERDEALASARREFPDVEYVIVGRVEEFHHSADVLPAEARRSFLGNVENRAIVAMRAVIVDVRTGRVAHDERFTGTAGAPESPTAGQYAHLGVDSALFESSPLGKASSEAARVMCGRLDVLAPRRVLEMQVIRAGTGREIIAAGGTRNGVERGQRYFVCRRDSVTGSLAVVRDEAMSIDLMAEVVRAGDSTCDLWLMGEPPASIMLSQCVLARERP